MQYPILIAASITVVAASTSVGQTVVNTFIVTPSTPQGWNASWAYYSNLGFDRRDELALKFTAEASGALTELRAAVFRPQSTLTGPAEFRLYDSVGASPGQPGSLIGAWQFTLQQALAGANTPPMSLELGGSTTVQAGQDYWLALRVPTLASPPWSWHIAGPLGASPDQANSLRRYGTDEWVTSVESDSAAFSLSIPSAATTLPLPLLLLSICRRRRDVDR